MLIITAKDGGICGILLGDEYYRVCDTQSRVTVDMVLGRDILVNVERGVVYENLSHMGGGNYIFTDFFQYRKFVDFNEGCCFLYDGDILHIYAGGVYYRVLVLWLGKTLMHLYRDYVSLSMILRNGFVGVINLFFDDAPSEIYLGGALLKGEHCTRLSFMRFLSVR